MAEAQREFEVKKQSFPYPLKKIGLYLDRDLLRKRVKKRIGKMLQLGLIDEVKEHLTLGRQDWAPLKSVGYKEVVSYLKNEISIAEMQERLIVNTMQLAKRQRTWFKKQENIHWFDVEHDKQKLKEVIF